MQQPLDRWTRHSSYSDPGRHRALLHELNGNPPAVCATARNVIGHYREEWAQLPDDRRDEVNSRWLEMILEVDQSRHAAPLSAPRPREERVAGCCRDHTLFAVGAFREHGVPARSRIGFAGYFAPGFHHDHVVVEHWTGDRWVRTDPELPDGDSLGFDARDMPTGRGAPFETAAEVWRGIRDERLDPDTYGVLPGSEWRGVAFVARYLVYEVAHRFGDELLLWDDWDGVHDPDPTWLDHLAGLLVAADAGDLGAEEQLSRLHAESDRLHPGPTVVQYSPFGDPPRTVSLRVPRARGSGAGEGDVE
jgi:hypothetical protein